MKELSTEELLEKYGQNKTHAQEVKRLSLMIFDEVNKKIKELTQTKKQMLESASLLHDIGYYIKAKGHNKHTQKIILEEGLSNFSPKQAMLISCICRYHRGGLPDKNDHEVYCTLDKKERKIVKQLGGILKIADGLESINIGPIQNITLDYDEKNNITEFLLRLESNDFYPDIMNVVRKKDLYEIGFKTQVVFKFI